MAGEPRQRPMLFEFPAKPRVVRAHAIDAGHFPDGRQCALFKCRKCGWKSGWIGIANTTEGRRGTPCKICNQEESND